MSGGHNMPGAALGAEEREALGLIAMRADNADQSLTDWHECVGCPGGPCACSGRPWLSDEMTTAIERILADHVRRARAEAVMEFAQWVATNRAYNGSDHRHGQSLYNECLNAVLSTWASEFAIETEETP